MKPNTKWLLVLAVGLLIAVPALAQNPTGTLKGRVADETGAGLPGVTITATSPNLQGERSTTSGASGDYKLAFMPPGEYKVTYELEGFATKVRTVKISAAQTSLSDVKMSLAEVEEEIIVTSQLATISETNTVASTTTQKELESLPINRTPLNAVNLAPGVADTGPSSSPVIHGSMSFENLFLVNGVVVNENIRGSFLPLFIEDAIQETTTSTAGVSAEYGRFTGGVVNVITKSGGNQFDGSLRVNYDNEDWISDQNRFRLNPDAEPNADVTNNTYEGTFGGPIWKDRIWFFLAGRDREETGTGSTTFTNITFPTADAETRTEAKLTLALTPSHSLIGSYLEIDRTRSGSTFGSVLDLRSLNNRTDPQEIQSGNYTGIITPNLFVEAQFSERAYEIATGFGGPPDLIEGTMMRHRPTGRRFWSSTFCGSCEPELRDNENTLAKGSYFLSTDQGSHDIVFGYDTFSDIRFSVNHQSGSDFQVWADDIFIDNNNNIFPIFSGSRTWIVWWPPVGLDIAQNTDFQTNSLYVNDSWQLNDKWSFNIGVRYDENDGRDSSGALVTDDSKLSPRLGLNYDVKGDGDLVINASYGTYVAAIANTGNVADGASTGGALAGFFSFYGGPQVNVDCPPNCVTTDVALGTLFDWYLGNGGTTDVDDAIARIGEIPNLFYSSIPGATVQVRQSLKSPSTDEFTVGATKRLGNKGLIRTDIVYRKGTDFYSERVTPGDTVDLNDDGTPDVDVVELGNFGNADLNREYLGIEFQGRYRVTDRFTLAGNYTLSELTGNINGETSGSGPVPGSPNVYREFGEKRWNYPEGNLSGDQTHKLRVWGIYDIVDNDHHNLSVSLLQNFFSGQPYSSNGSIDTNPGSRTGDYIRATFPQVAQYVQPPASQGYFFGGRGNFKTDDITRTDIALNYAFRWNMFGRSVEVFLQPEVVNVFDEDAVTAPVQTVLDFEGGDRCPNGAGGFCEDFNAFTETPVRGVHYELDDEFGQPDGENDFQQPRTFRFSVGFRF